MCKHVKVMGASVRGRSHVINGSPCQDAWRRIHLEDGTEILAVADGHGGDEYIHSDIGAKIATHTFTELVKRHIDVFGQKGFGRYMRWLGTLKFAYELEREWKRRVLQYHGHKYTYSELTNEEILRQYGTTILGMVITDTEVITFSIGDGNAVLVCDAFSEVIIEEEEVYGTETHSLCEDGAWRWAECTVRLKVEGRHMYWLSTDGFANSYRNNSEFIATCCDYYDRITESFRGVSMFMKGWLAETSYYGSGDDITVLLAYEGDDGDECV